VDLTADRDFVCVGADSTVYLSTVKTRLVKSSSVYSYNSTGCRLHCGKRLPVASFDIGSRFLFVCSQLVFLLLVRRVLLCHLKRSVLQQQRSLIHKFVGIVNKHGHEAFPRDGRDVGRTRLIGSLHKSS
jgi:hypothetical protein